MEAEINPFTRPIPRPPSLIALVLSGFSNLFVILPAMVLNLINESNSRSPNSIVKTIEKIRDVTSASISWNVSGDDLTREDKMSLGIDVTRLIAECDTLWEIALATKIEMGINKMRLTILTILL